MKTRIIESTKTAETIKSKRGLCFTALLDSCQTAMDEENALAQTVSVTKVESDANKWTHILNHVSDVSTQ